MVKVLAGTKIYGPPVIEKCPIIQMFSVFYENAYFDFMYYNRYISYLLSPLAFRLFYQVI